MSAVRIRTPPAPRPHDRLSARCFLPRPGRAWLSSYYLVFLACFLDLAESTKKAHGTEGTSRHRRSKKEGWHQKQSDLQGNQGRHEPARMCSFARFACCRRRRPAPIDRCVRFASSRLVFLFPTLVPPAGAWPAWGGRGSRGRAAASTARLSFRTHYACELDSRVHIFSSLLTNSIGRESSRCLTRASVVAQSARLPLEATLFPVPMWTDYMTVFSVPEYGLRVHADIQLDLHDAAHRPLVRVSAVPRSYVARVPA